MPLPILEPLWTAADARAADAHTIGALGVPGIALMERAGRATAEAALELVPRLERAVVVAGPGNNGGDGWVVARRLWEGGVRCPVLTLKDPEQLTGDARTAAQLFVSEAKARAWTAPGVGGAFTLLAHDANVRGLAAEAGAQVVVDAVFGTGLSRPPEGLAAHVIQALAQLEVPVLAVDLPSGLPTDGEAPAGPCVRANTTVTFGGRKLAHASEPGVRYCGDVRVTAIGIVSAPGAIPAGHLLVDAAPLLPAPDPDAHKNRYGHVAVCAGNALGAARLAALACLRAGAGLTTVLIDTPLLVPEPEPMLRPRNAASLEGMSALVVGPGLGDELDDEAHALLEAAAARGLPAVVDAEALDVLAQRPVQGLRAVATPHPGEAARVLGTSSQEVQRHRVAAARALAQRFGPDVVVVLKGSAPVVQILGAPPVLVPGAVPSLAVAGSGDVLAGCIGGLLARRLSPGDAALLGVWAHQRAGRALASTGVTRGWLASEIAAALPRALLAADDSRMGRA